MKHKIREHKNISIVSLEGNILGGPDALILNDLLRELIRKGKKKIILDISSVKLINSSGLGMLIAALTSVKTSNGDLKLAGGSDKIQNLLTITKLKKIFEQYKTVKQAVDSYQ